MPNRSGPLLDMYGAECPVLNG
eukprot:COSAG05_NODE_29256_length_110_cov_70.636364_1_plen_21_part_10